MLEIHHLLCPLFLSSVLSVLMADFAVRRFLVFHNLFPIFIPKMNTFGIIMLMRQIILNIMHVDSIMT